MAGMPAPLTLDDLGTATPGVLPSQLLADAAQAGWVDAGELRIPPSNIQPASLDLRLGERAYRIRCSFLPGAHDVESKIKGFIVDELDLRREGAVLETGRPYLVPLAESLSLPPFVRAKANPKSSTGRLDVFTRVVTDGSYRFDEVAVGYQGPLYLEVVPISFAVRVHQGLALNQLRLMIGQAKLTDGELRAHQGREPLLYLDGRAAADHEVATGGGMFLSLDLSGGRGARVGYRAREHTMALDVGRPGTHRPEDYWEEVRAEEEGRVVLGPERFYLLLSRESVRVPPHLACEMTAYDPTSGELRAHYAGFFDPGFGYDAAGELKGSRAALEVRAHDVPFMVEHGQQVCRLTFERMICPPSKLYGQGIGSNYQGQVDTLGKHFRRPE
ncbi:MAG TPA: 2'-deoxycytidine 5'-triphosphate deaminase [Acidimicrobiales bacterium]|nr:2'-deoxycytidine 5'-triphosphate deaminase [Acidimicrobiales bacterium]